jgi:hypothetical protein
VAVTVKDIEAAIEFLTRLYVGQVDEERLHKTIKALKAELAKRRKK